VKLDRLLTFFLTNPSAKLLRATHAPHIVYFLNQHFKVEGNLATLHAELRHRLNQYLEGLHTSEPEVLRERAEVYLTQWSTGDTRWLRRYFDSQHAEPVYQLTPHTEAVLKFLTESLEQTLGFVGTESRLTRIIDTLTNIVVRGSDDPERRLQHLYSERERIDREIRSIEAGDAVTTHTPTAIRERFADVVSDLVSLQGDFRAVEDSFKEITRDVRRQQTESTDSRGEILGFALDAEDRLKEEDQGASFTAFVHLILSQTQQAELERIILQLDEIEELAAQGEGKARVKGMIDHLSAEAEKVLHTTRRLSSTLRRLLDTRSSASRVRLASVLREIQAAAVRRAENPPEVGINVQTELDLFNPFSRTFWQSPVEFDDMDLANDQPDEDDRMIAFRMLAEMQRLDWGSMRSNIGSLVRSEAQVSLPDLLAAHPPQSGSIEVLGYIQIAHDDGHRVDDEQMDVVNVNGADNPQWLEIPRVVFLPERVRLLRENLESGSAAT